MYSVPLVVQIKPVLESSSYESDYVSLMRSTTLCETPRMGIGTQLMHLVRFGNDSDMHPSPATLAYRPSDRSPDVSDRREGSGGGSERRHVRNSHTVFGQHQRMCTDGFARGRVHTEVSASAYDVKIHVTSLKQVTRS